MLWDEPDLVRNGPMEKKTKINVWYIIAAGLGVMMLQNMWSQSKQVEVIPYS
jgi:hypothetical protein